MPRGARRAPVTVGAGARVSTGVGHLRRRPAAPKAPPAAARRRRAAARRGLAELEEVRNHGAHVPRLGALRRSESSDSDIAPRVAGETALSPSAAASAIRSHRVAGAPPARPSLAHARCGGPSRRRARAARPAAPSHTRLRNERAGERWRRADATPRSGGEGGTGGGTPSCNTHGGGGGGSHRAWNVNFLGIPDAADRRTRRYSAG